MRDGDGDTALGGAVELREYDPIQIERIVELPRLGKPILSRRRIDHEDDRDGEHRAPARDVHDLGKLPHEIRARVKAPCRVNEDEIGALALGALAHIIADARRIRPPLASDDLDAGALAPDLERSFNPGVSMISMSRNASWAIFNSTERTKGVNSPPLRFIALQQNP